VEKFPAYHKLAPAGSNAKHLEATEPSVCSWVTLIGFVLVIQDQEAARVPAPQKLGTFS
jgi:hypothetical protein